MYRDGKPQCVEAGPGGRNCTIFNDDIFYLLREHHEVPENFLATWSPSSTTIIGGKSGSKIVYLPGGFVVKELRYADHESLLELAQSYGLHMSQGESHLTHIYMHFQDVVSKRYFFVMENAVFSSQMSTVFDMKGTSDDRLSIKDGHFVQPVHKRAWKLHLWFGQALWSDERVAYHEGKQSAQKAKFQMCPTRRRECLDVLQRDVEFLSSAGIMDYSLLIAASTKKDFSGNYPIEDQVTGNSQSLKLSLVDFLQRWTFAKKAARALKFFESRKSTVPPQEYALRFYKHFEDCFVEHCVESEISNSDLNIEGDRKSLKIVNSSANEHSS